MKNVTITLRAMSPIIVLVLFCIPLFGQYENGNLNVEIDYFEQELKITYKAGSVMYFFEGGYRANIVDFKIIGSKTDNEPYEERETFQGGFLGYEKKDTTYTFQYKIPNYSETLNIYALEFKNDHGSKGDLVVTKSLSLPVELNLKSNDGQFALNAKLQPNSLFNSFENSLRNKCFEKIFTFKGQASTSDIISTTLFPSNFIVSPKDEGKYLEISFDRSLGQVTYSHFGDANTTTKHADRYISSHHGNNVVARIELPNDLNLDTTFNHCTPVVVHFYQGDEIKYTLVIPVLVIGQNVDNWVGETQAAPSLHTILHHAPGDGSYTSLNSTSNVCSEETMEVLQSEGEFGSASLKVSSSIPVPIPINIGVSAEVGIEGGTESTTGSDHTIIKCWEFNETFTTKTEELLTGRDGDLYIGTTSTYEYGPALEVTHIEGDVVVHRTLALRKIKSEVFKNTGAYIKKQINKLESQTQDPRIANEIRAWKHMIDSNEKYVSERIASQQSSRIQLTNATTKSKKSTFTKSFSATSEIFVESGAFTNLGFEFGPVEANASASFTVKSTVSQSTKNEESNSIEVGYVLYDGEKDDEFFLFESTDERFGTPIWVLDTLRSQTSCPYEGGYALDQPKIKAQIGDKLENRFFVNAVPGDTIRIPLKISNSSKIARIYNLQSNEIDAQIVIGSSRLVKGHKIPFPLKSFEDANVVLSIVQSNFSNVTSYKDITLYLTSDCDDEIKDSLVFTVSFEQLQMTPGDTLVSSASGELNVTVNSNATWQVTDNADWLSIADQENGSFKVAYDQNPDKFNFREAQITVTTSGGTSKTITLKQEPYHTFIIVTPGDTVVPANSTQLTFSVKSNAEWAVMYQSEWLQIANAHGTNDGFFIATYGVNPDTESPRIAEISLTAGNVTLQKIVFVQARATQPCFIEFEDQEARCLDNGAYEYSLKPIGENTSGSYSVYDAAGNLIKEKLPYGKRTIIDTVASGVEIEPITIRDDQHFTTCQYTVYIVMPACNEGTDPNQLSKPAADFQITGISTPPAIITSGDQFQMHTVVANLGTDDAPIKTKAFYWLSTDEKLDIIDSTVPADVFLAEDNISALPIGKTNDEYEMVTIPSNTPEGHYFLIYQADALDQVEELDENNNIVVREIYVQRPSDRSSQSFNETITPLPQNLTALEGSGNKSLSSGVQLAQNDPNPAIDQTTIPVSISENAASASIQITGMDGKIVKVLPLSERGTFEVDVNTGDLYDGVWLYSLIVDNQLVDTKRMMVGKM